MFGHVVLLRGVRVGNMMVNATLLKMAIGRLIFPLPNQISSELAFNSILKLNRYVKDITFPFEGDEPSVFAIVVNENDIT